MSTKRHFPDQTQNTTDMDSLLGSTLILWTVRLSVGLYAAALWRYLFVLRRKRQADRIYLILWTASWVMCVIHVLCAFHFEHHWSHAAGLRHTAEMTGRVVGIYWDGGLYINYAFLAWWGLDVGLLWAGSRMRVSVSLQAVAAFMMFNATAIFGPVWWWLPVGSFLVLIAAVWHRDRKGRQNLSEMPSRTA